MSAATGPDLDNTEKLWKIINLQADTRLKDLQAQHQITNFQADTMLKSALSRWEPWKVVFSALAAGGVFGGALVGGTIALFRWKLGG